jgi:hypothetical protein
VNVPHADTRSRQSKLSNSEAQLLQDAGGGVLGHNETLQQATRLATAVTDSYGRLRPAGTAVPIQEDFNTIDNPFAWSTLRPMAGAPQRPRACTSWRSRRPAAKFHAARNAMDGVLPDGTNLRSAPTTSSTPTTALTG